MPEVTQVDIAGEVAPGRGPGESLESTIRQLLDGQLYGVLCTQGQGQPYGSLVAYAMTRDLDSAVFATQKSTWKYRLLCECALVSLVVDNRSALPGRLLDVEAVTATGRAHEVAPGSEFEQWARLLTDRHPYLDTFVRPPSCGLFRIDIERYVHVTRFQEVQQWIPGSRA
jgi:nitroimidazol reductase NimA-like FMN-containing flavoprotein (pyridoxamine 5'-phosphate oxidase superfamily)